MILFPAIDLKDGKCVRLKQGDFNDVKVYSENPLTVAKQFEQEGATFIHVVDLDGARTGNGVNKEIIKKIVEETNLYVQVGGGIRTLESINEWIRCGVKRVILGTIALENQEFVKEAIKLYGERIAVGVDARDSKVATHGWETLTNMDSLTFCNKLRGIGVKTIIYTDISKDGMLSGPNIEVYKKLINLEVVRIIASGGIGSLQDLKELVEIGAYGVITGKAIYEGKFTVKEALQCLQEESFRA
ncbi:1-(5-phosphoribosyl)-5-[(5-phosphoribosylamino)methylideneamino]imidazole-4-carboxamide isomerase [Bacillus sp. AFS001701]|uniref:1-(5-phosphoribosyl)-5-[(5- phosphoribosylamino)methylideneamino]imidazole-4- carboxamide isomerase n=1 Tax=Bacillus sp. AFS001701 TaxID=2033480 RepID=UPI000BF35329|nr:1-(5-phosphoribosyl)-5-[(5-phosphoribosylamino)methylideneamino]imidazole-4-carboxamide isomerase [Bacillus sp. AFS001701]PET58421.1 1-(5-phosphoribosyl)-5-[(5-phosphoribosylamino)methylideneamino]imidazole-4-carboxamide isomerase [Bacillus sp. AFS001701]